LLVDFYFFRRTISSASPEVFSPFSVLAAPRCPGLPHLERSRFDVYESDRPAMPCASIRPTHALAVFRLASVMESFRLTPRFPFSADAVFDFPDHAPSVLFHAAFRYPDFPILAALPNAYARHRSWALTLRSVDPLRRRRCVSTRLTHVSLASHPPRYFFVEGPFA